jgi:adenylylsulfate kinase
MSSAGNKDAPIYPFEGEIKVGHRHQMNRHRSGLVWFCGLSGSGKSTLAHAVEARLFEMKVRSYVLDGDNVRSGLNRDLGLSPGDRQENVRRIAEVAKLMVDAGILVFAAFITPYEKSRCFVRQLLEDRDYFECYVRCDLEVCRQRDPKGLYAKAQRGEITGLTGVSAPFEEPDNYDLLVDTSQLNLDLSVAKVIDFLIGKGMMNGA